MTASVFGYRRLDDPASRRVVEALEAVGAGRSAVELPAMSTTFRDDLRRQLVAVTPRLVAEGPLPTEQPAADRAIAPAAPARRRRPFTVLVAGAAVVVLGVGGATYLAQGALPGDALYGLKRTSENVSLSLSGSDTDKGHALLVDAQTRVEEAQSLLARPQALALSTRPAAGGVDARTAGLVSAALASADDDTRQGLTLIADAALAGHDAAGLDLAAAWAQGQQRRIAEVAAQLAGSSAAGQAATSADAIALTYERAGGLAGEIAGGVDCADRARDGFGPKTCASTPAPVTVTPTTGAEPATPNPGDTVAPGPAPTTASDVESAPTSAPATGDAAVPAGPSSLPTQGVTLGNSSLGATLDPCGAQVGLPVATVSLGGCATAS